MTKVKILDNIKTIKIYSNKTIKTLIDNYKKIIKINIL